MDWFDEEWHMQEKEPVRVLVTAHFGVGGVTNMYSIVESMAEAGKIIRP